MKDFFKALKITHEWFGYSPDAPFEEKVKCIEARVREVKSEGYGGVVTNVHCVNYLKDPAEWELMKEKVRICKENDMRLWLYDENGYPSGAAGTETISANLDYEARAVVMVAKLLYPGETWTSTLPHGHEKPISAFAYYVDGLDSSDEALEQVPIRPEYKEGFSFANTSSTQNLLCLAFYQKHMYEGGHCEHNCCAARRYFDISNRDAVREFINNTYKKYADTVGEYFSPSIGDTGENSVIEAIFTDEPSYMGFYINAELVAPHTVHPVDKEIPLYPVILWGRDFANRFASVNGFRIEDYMPYLFLGGSEKARQIRRRFYQLSSDLLEQNFFAQVSDYCASVGLQFSGHILLEDFLHDHVAFEGNFFSLLRHMHIPGFDFLNSVPERVWDSAFTPLLVSSVAQIYNKKHVMDEVSAHAQGGNVTLQQIYTSVLLQYALGADVFTSYYGENYPLEEQKKLWDSISVAQSLTQDKEDRSSTLIYYPIETMMQLRKPVHNVTEPTDKCAELISKCENSMYQAMYLLLNHQVPFNFCDSNSIPLALSHNPKVFIIGASFLENEFIAKVKELSKSGCRVIYFCDKEHNNSSGEFKAEFEKIKDFAVFAANTEELLSLVASVHGGLRTSGNTHGIASLWTNSGVLLVNSEGNAKDITFEKSTARSAVDIASGKQPELRLNSDKKSVLTLEGYAAVFVRY